MVDYFRAPAGLLKIEANAQGITAIRFVEHRSEPAVVGDLTSLCKEQLREYFAGKRRSFDLPLVFEGTGFEVAVWKAAMQIPYGQVMTYAGLAGKIGRPKAYRAVANALGKNKHVIVVPCHRVVAKGGVGGFSAGIDRKKFLLELEAASLTFNSR